MGIPILAVSLVPSMLLIILPDCLQNIHQFSKPGFLNIGFSFIHLKQFFVEYTGFACSLFTVDSVQYFEDLAVLFILMHWVRVLGWLILNFAYDGRQRIFMSSWFSRHCLLVVTICSVFEASWLFWWFCHYFFFFLQILCYFLLTDGQFIQKNLEWFPN